MTSAPRGRRTWLGGGGRPRSREAPPVTAIFSVAMGLKRKKSVACQPSRRKRPGEVETIKREVAVALRWQSAARRALRMADPWAGRHLERLKTERVRRMRYNALSREWLEDQALVKMEAQPFGRGAMRECFRLKKLSSFSPAQNWSHACNYVAKRYLEPTQRETYLEDVRLQMDAKLWAEEFNRHNPPKKVDIFQVSVIEFVEREGSPLYHLEHFIEGSYTKYNSNSGFISNQDTRLTPQAFSHFTFERSGHELLVVDVQGVGDLYTDPQIHTAGGEDYGEGNLGVRGMALFFHSHRCNCVCEGLGLTPFDLAPHEQPQVRTPHCKWIWRPKRASQKLQQPTPNKSEKVSFANHAHVIYHIHVAWWTIYFVRLSEQAYPSQKKSLQAGAPAGPLNYPRSAWDAARTRPGSGAGWGGGVVTSGGGKVRERRACERGPSRGRGSPTKDAGGARGVLLTRLGGGDEMLRPVLAELASKSTPKPFGMDLFQVWFYAHSAAVQCLCFAVGCSDITAVVFDGVGHLRKSPVDSETSAPQENEENVSRGVDYLEQAARAGDRASMISLAKALDTGIGLGSRRERDWAQACLWYGLALSRTEEDDEGEYDGCMDDPDYLLLARQAELTLQGGHGLPRDPLAAGELYQRAATAATVAMKGRLANKYYQLAEEAAAQE
ncbi:unnamed protein product [Ixodes hexagonus]